MPKAGRCGRSVRSWAFPGLRSAITFAVPNISWGGHLGGLIGGALATLALTHFGTRHVAYARITPVAVVSLIAIGVGSVVIAYWRVRGLA